MTDELPKTPSAPSADNKPNEHVISFDGVCSVQKISPTKLRVIDKTANFTFYYDLRGFVNVITILFGVEKAEKVGSMLGEGQTVIVDFPRKKILRVKKKPVSPLGYFLNEQFSAENINAYLGSNPTPNYRNQGGSIWRQAK